MKSTQEPIEVRARNVDTAIEQGLAQLGLNRHQVDIEVLRPGSRGVLGIGAEDAVVRLTPRGRSRAVEVVPPVSAPKPVKKEHAEQAVPARPVMEKEEPAEKVAPPAQPAPKPRAAAEGMSEEEIADLAQGLLSELLDHLGVDAQVTVSYGEAEDGEERPLLLDVVGRDLGILIGRRGDTLAALQFLMRLMVNNHAQRWLNLVVDVEGYKARRERMLRELALRMAERAVSTGRVVALEAMPARERRIVHIALRDHSGVTTQSIGEGEARKVTIIPN